MFKNYRKRLMKKYPSRKFSPAATNIFYFHFNFGRPHTFLNLKVFRPNLFSFSTLCVCVTQGFFIVQFFGKSKQPLTGTLS